MWHDLPWCYIHRSDGVFNVLLLMAYYFFQFIIFYWPHQVRWWFTLLWPQINLEGVHLTFFWGHFNASVKDERFGNLACPVALLPRFGKSNRKRSVKSDPSGIHTKSNISDIETSGSYLGDPRGPPPPPQACFCP